MILQHTKCRRGLQWCFVLALALSFSVCTRTQVPAQLRPVTPSAEDKRKALDADVERLVQLARQLKTEVDHSRRDELSVKVVREADEIERLARSARGRLH